MGPATTGTLGQVAERQAQAYLVQRGLGPVARNFRCRGGEIDLVMMDDDCLVFVEVRCRRSTRFTRPALTVDRRKQDKLIRTAATFVARHRHLADRTMRFDVVAITAGDDGGTEWIRDAFRPRGSAL